jgi:DNA polymerase-3 subunit beta
MGLPKDDFPKLPEPDSATGAEIDQQVLKECLNLTTFAVSHDETRYVLNGILCVIKDGKLKLVATDGRRLAFVQKGIAVPPQFSFEAIIPTKTVQELNKILTEQGKVRLIPLKNQVIFNFGDIWVISRLIEGHFPNYEQVIPKEEKTVSTVDRETLLSAVRRASLLTSPESQSIKVDVLKNKLLISSRSPNLGEAREEVEADTEGDDLVIGFNPNYLIDVLKNLDVEKVSLRLSNPDKPGLVRGKDDYLCVIMPMQLN